MQKRIKKVWPMLRGKIIININEFWVDSPVRLSKHFKGTVKICLKIKRICVQRFKEKWDNNYTTKNGSNHFFFLTTFIQHCTGGPSQCDNARKWKKYNLEMKKKKQPLFTDEIIMYLKKFQWMYIKATGIKWIWQGCRNIYKNQLCLYISNE